MSQWHQEFDQQPLRVAHRADCHGLELQLDGPGPWKAGKEIFNAGTGYLLVSHVRKTLTVTVFKCTIPSSLKVGDFDVYHVPGHSAGSLFYALPKLSAIFTGDREGSFGLPKSEPRRTLF